MCCALYIGYNITVQFNKYCCECNIHIFSLFIVFVSNIFVCASLESASAFWLNFSDHKMHSFKVSQFFSMATNLHIADSRCMQLITGDRELGEKITLQHLSSCLIYNSEVIYRIIP